METIGADLGHWGQLRPIGVFRVGGVRRLFLHSVALTWTPKVYINSPRLTSNDSQSSHDFTYHQGPGSPHPTGTAPKWLQARPDRSPLSPKRPGTLVDRPNYRSPAREAPDRTKTPGAWRACHQLVPNIMTVAPYSKYRCRTRYHKFLTIRDTSALHTSKSCWHLLRHLFIHINNT